MTYRKLKLEHHEPHMVQGNICPSLWQGWPFVLWNIVRLIMWICRIITHYFTLALLLVKHFYITGSPWFYFCGSCQLLLIHNSFIDLNTIVKWHWSPVGCCILLGITVIVFCLALLSNIYSFRLLYCMGVCLQNITGSYWLFCLDITVHYHWFPFSFLFWVFL